MLFGAEGLRAGWSLLLFVLSFALIASVLNGLLAHSQLLPPTTHDAPHVLTPRLVLVGDAFNFGALALAALLLAAIERRPFGRFGLSAHRVAPDLALGGLTGVLALSLLVLLLSGSHHLVFAGATLGGPTGLTFGLQWLLAFLFVGLFEEFGFRGYLQWTLARGLSGLLRALSPQTPYAHAGGFALAAFLLSVLLFAGTHTGNGGETVAGIAAVAAAGAMFAFSLWRTGSLWWAIGFHTTWDWAQTYLYGTADSGTPAAGHLLTSHPLGSALLSGGPDGPEGSIFALPVLALVALVIHLTLPRRAYFLTPSQRAPASPGADAEGDEPLN